MRLLVVTLIISFFSSILFAQQVGNWDCKGFDIHCSQVGFPSEICKSNPDAWLTDLEPFKKLKVKDAQQSVIL